MINKSRLLLCVIAFILATVTGRAENITPSEVESVIKTTITKIEAIETYQFLFIKREIVDNRDTGYQFMNVKLQTNPFKVYLKFQEPEKYKDREVLYQDDELLIKRGGTRMSNMVLSLDPNGAMAMDDNRYPITHMDPNVLCTQLIKNIRDELKYPDTLLQKGDASYKEQPGTLYQLIHKTKADGQRCQAAQMVISKEHSLPIYFKVLNWADKVVENYGFSDVKVNDQLDDNAFNEDNKEYGFNKRKDETTR